MKKLMLVAALLVIASVPMHAETPTCYVYYNVMAYDDGFNHNWCWMYGSVCYQCVDVSRGRGCAKDGVPCDPDASRALPQPPRYLIEKAPLQPAMSGEKVTVRRQHNSSILPPARMARLKVGALL